MDVPWRVAERLAHGRFVSGQALAEELGVTRATIWKGIHDLERRGLPVHAVRGRGYRLAAPVEWLDAAAVLGALPPATRRLLEDLAVHRELDSTSSALLAAGPPPPGRARVCLVDYQAGGRGRRGRAWVSSPGAGVCLSVGWQFERPPRGLSALGQVAALAVRRAVETAGVRGVRLKWPNDLVAGGRKLGGLLTELRAEANGPAFVVMGIGLNHRLPAAAAAAITGGLPPVDLAELCDGRPPGRNAAAAALVAALVSVLDRYAEAGPGNLVADWAAVDALAGRPVELRMDDTRIAGIAAGLEPDGALRLETDAGTRRVTAGDVSVRPRR